MRKKWNNKDPKDAKILTLKTCLYKLDKNKAVNDVIADKNVVTRIMNNSTGLQRIELYGFSKRHWQTGYYPFAYGVS